MGGARDRHARPVDLHSQLLTGSDPAAHHAGRRCRGERRRAAVRRLGAVAPGGNLRVHSRRGTSVSFRSRARDRQASGRGRTPALGSRRAGVTRPPATPDQQSPMDTTEPGTSTAHTAVASFGQQRMWLIDRLLPGKPLYNEMRTERVRGPLDVAILQRALDDRRRTPRPPADAVRSGRQRAAAGDRRRGADRDRDRGRRRRHRGRARSARTGGGRGRGRGAVRPRTRAAAARAAPAPCAGRTLAGHHHAPHHLRRVDRRGSAARAVGALRSLCPGRALVIARTAGPVRRLRDLAARADAGRVSRAGSRVLEGRAGRRAGAGVAARPAAAGGPRSPRRAARLRHRRGGRAGAEGAFAPRGRDAVHDAARRLPRPASPLQRPGRHRGGRAHRRAQPARARGHARLLRQHAGAAWRSRRRPAVHRTPAAGAQHGARRVLEPGCAVREAGRGARPVARPLPQSAVPGDVRAAEHAGARLEHPGTGGRRRHRTRGGERQVRPLVLRHGAGWTPCGPGRLHGGALRRSDDRPDGRAIPDAALARSRRTRSRR